MALRAQRLVLASVAAAVLAVAVLPVADAPALHLPLPPVCPVDEQYSSAHAGAAITGTSPYTQPCQYRFPEWGTPAVSPTSVSHPLERNPIDANRPVVTLSFESGTFGFEQARTVGDWSGILHALRYDPTISPVINPDGYRILDLSELGSCDPLASSCSYQVRMNPYFTPETADEWAGVYFIPVGVATVFPFDPNLHPQCAGGQLLPDGATCVHEAQVALYVAFELHIGEPGAGPPPGADFTWRPTGNPFEIEFDGSASTDTPPGLVTAWAWDFGDGATGTGEQATHAFGAPGVYEVSLEVTDDDSQADSVTKSVEVGRLTVNSTADAPDADLADHLCDTGVDLADGAAECTLRAAIETANARGGRDEIRFAIPGTGTPTIAPTSPLPSVDEPAALDATTQSGGRVALVGSVGGNGLVIRGGDTLVRGFAIGGFSGSAVRLETGAGNVVVGNDIGVDASGAVVPNRFGVLVVGSSGNMIGGGTSSGDDANAIVGSTFAEVLVESTAAAGATGNRIEGNHIGVDRAGAVVAGGPFGVVVSGPETFPSPTTGNRVAGNVITGNTVNVELAGPSASDNVVVGNTIGVGADGAPPADAASIQRAGVRVDGAPRNHIGEADSPNRIAAHTVGQVLIYGDVRLLEVPQDDAGGTPTLRLDWTVDPLPGNASSPGDETVVEGNVLGPLDGGDGAGFAQAAGVYLLRGADRTTVRGNAIADVGIGVFVLDVADTAIRANTIGPTALNSGGGIGVLVGGGDRTVVGGTGPGDGNVIADSDTGASIGGRGSDDVAHDTRVVGNRIGTSPGGTAAAPNRHGITVGFGAQATVIGEPGAGNLLSGNTETGVLVTAEIGQGVNPPTGTRIDSNLIGTRIDGLTPLPNGQAGVATVGDVDTTVVHNTIGFNPVVVASNTHTRITENRIFGTQGIGIDLAPLGSVNPLGGGTPSSNGGIGTPDLASAKARVKTKVTVIEGHLPAGDSLHVEVFENPDCDTPGLREGRDFRVARDLPGGPFELVLPAQLAYDKGVTVTATDAAGHTSELSNCVEVEPGDDRDRDGITDDVEDAGPNGGDANVDGIPDKEQAGVTTLVGTTGLYFTLVAAPGQVLRGVEAVVPPEEPPAGATFPAGFVDFRVEGLEPGGTAVVDVLLPAGAVATGWWQFGPPGAGLPPTFYEFTFDPSTGTGAELNGGSVRLHLADGGRGDHDLRVNGAVTDPGGAAGIDAAALSALFSPPDPSPSGPTGTLAFTGGGGVGLVPLALGLLLIGRLLLASTRMRAADRVVALTRAAAPAMHAPDPCASDPVALVDEQSVLRACRPHPAHAAAPSRGSRRRRPRARGPPDPCSQGP